MRLRAAVVLAIGAVLAVHLLGSGLGGGHACSHSHCGASAGEAFLVANAASSASAAKPSFGWQESTARRLRGATAVAAAAEVDAAETVLSSQYDLEGSSSRSISSGRRKFSGQEETLQGMSDLDRLAFDQNSLFEYVMSRPLGVFRRAAFLISVAAGIWKAWNDNAHESTAGAGGAAGASGYNPASLAGSGQTATRRGEALRAGLADMGVFFVKIGQTMAQRPDLVGDDLAEELKGLQEKNAPFDDATAHRIIAEDLNHKGPVAPGVLWDGCDPSLPPLLAEMGARHVASASLGQVYRGYLHDGREVALKVQRPGVREVIGLDWAAAVLACRVYLAFSQGLNDYSLIVDTVAQGIRKELDYHEEAANLEEFAVRHAFLPFVTSPGWMPEYTGPRGAARVLCMNWYPSRAPKDLNREERRELVEMAVEACVVQLLVTGFVHADPHEGNLRLGDDGRVVFLDFGLMDRVDFGVMECFAAGIKCVLSKDWVELSRIMQEVRFTPTPLMKVVQKPGVKGGANKNSELVECDRQEFAEALREQMEQEDGGMSRFGAMATALKKMSNRYVMLTPPYVALLCRTFITLEGLLGDDPQMAEEFNIYEVALPFAIRRVLSPRTRKGQVQLREALLKEEPRARRGRALAAPRWEALAALLDDPAGEEASTQGGHSSIAGSPHAAAPSSHEDPFGATEGVQRRLLRTTEGAAIRRFLYDVDVFDALQSFLVSRDSRPLRRKVVDALAESWSARKWQAGGKHKRRRPSSWGPRSSAASHSWGQWRREDPFRLPAAALKSSRIAWRLVLRRQLSFALWPPWRLPYRATVGLTRVLVASLGLGLTALLRAALLRWRALAAASAAAREAGRGRELPAPAPTPER